MFGRYVFGIASALLGIACLTLRDQLISNWQLPGDGIFLVITSAALVVGGVAMLLPRTQRLGALVSGIVYLVFALTFVPDIFAHPALYASYGNVFYQLAPAAGALVASSAIFTPAAFARTGVKVAIVVLGLCNASFAIEQVEFLARTASLVPTWMPPGQTFWAIATTVAFGLAAVSIVSGYKSLTASRLLTAMFVAFGILIWIPILIADPKTHGNWSEGLETFAIAGATWIVADELASRRRRPAAGFAG